VQTKIAECTNHTKDSDWENLVQRRTIAYLFTLFKAYSGESYTRQVAKALLFE